MSDDDSTPVRGQTIVVTTVTYRDRVLLDMITKGIFGAFPGGRRVVFDFTGWFDLKSAAPFQELLDSVAKDGVDVGLNGLATNAQGEASVYRIRDDDPVAGAAAARVVRDLARGLVDRGVFVLIVAKPFVQTTPDAEHPAVIVSSGGFTEVIVCVNLSHGRHHPRFNALQRVTMNELRLMAPADDGDSERDGRGDYRMIDDYRVSLYDIDDPRYTQMWFSRLYEDLGLRIPQPLPQSVPWEVADQVMEAFTKEGMDNAFVPDSLGARLQTIDSVNFGATGNPGSDDSFEAHADRPPFAGFGLGITGNPSPDDLYQFDPPLDHILKGGWESRVQFGLSGHGMDSYAWSYLLVADGIAVVGQIGRGFVHADMRRTDKTWAALIDGTTALHWEATRGAPIPDTHLLLVAVSDIRCVSSWQWLKRDSLESVNHELRRSKMSGGGDVSDISDLFTDAIHRGLGGPR